jgi:hypothetical protein
VVSTRFWADDFDMDLPKVLPRFDDALGDMGDARLWTFGNASHGRLNHPSVWGDPNRAGFNAYFGSGDRDPWKPASFVTDAPLVECTWREAVRDAWPHTYRIVVDGRPVWDAVRLWGPFNKLMFDVRGWSRLSARKADNLRGAVLASLYRATDDLRSILASEAVAW